MLRKSESRKNKEQGKRAKKRFYFYRGEMLLYGKPVIEKLFSETKERVTQYAPNNAYIGLLLASDDFASGVYVTKKQEYAERCGLSAKLFQHPEASLDTVLAQINEWNADPVCVGIVVQLPLGKHLKPFQAKILSAVAPLKDVDGLGGQFLGMTLNELVNFIPATPKATFELLDFYQLGNLEGKMVTMIGQSNLMGKPFVLEAMRRGATVLSTNSKTPQEVFKKNLQESDIIVTATGVVDLVTPALFDHQDLTGKVIIDVGYGIKNGKACGDTDRKGLSKLGASITPVPGGVGPVTVSCLFHNMLALHHISVLGHTR